MSAEEQIIQFNKAENLSSDQRNIRKLINQQKSLRDLPVDREKLNRNTL